MGANHGENTITHCSTTATYWKWLSFFFVPFDFLFVFFLFRFLQLFFSFLKSVFFYIILQMRNCAAYFVNTYTVCMGHIHKTHIYANIFHALSRSSTSHLVSISYARLFCVYVDFFFIYFFLFSNSRRNHGFAAIGSFLCSTEQWCWFFFFFRFFLLFEFLSLWRFSCLFFDYSVCVLYGIFRIFNQHHVTRALWKWWKFD